MAILADNLTMCRVEEWEAPEPEPTPETTEPTETTTEEVTS